MIISNRRTQKGANDQHDVNSTATTIIIIKLFNYEYQDSTLIIYAVLL
jgi:hypothetical protein